MIVAQAQTVANDRRHSRVKITGSAYVRTPPPLAIDLRDSHVFKQSVVPGLEVGRIPGLHTYSLR